MRCWYSLLHISVFSSAVINYKIFWVRVGTTGYFGLFVSSRFDSLYIFMNDCCNDFVIYLKNTKERGSSRKNFI